MTLGFDLAPETTSKEAKEDSSGSFHQTETTMATFPPVSSWHLWLQRWLNFKSFVNFPHQVPACASHFLETFLVLFGSIPLFFFTLTIYMTNKLRCNRRELPPFVWSSLIQRHAALKQKILPAQLHTFWFSYFGWTCIC